MTRSSPFLVRIGVGAAITATLAAGSTTQAAPKKPVGAAPSTAASGLPVEEHILSNGMKVVLIPSHLAPTVSGAWVAHVGSANERPGITGISHLFEHMMFKGSHVIGTRDYPLDEKLIEQQEQVQDQMRAELSRMRAQQRRGEIDDMTKPEARTPRYRELEATFDSLVAAQRANMIKNEFNLVLQQNGATFINAFTNEDQTTYFETVPSNKLELWFWMEADRLKNRVFREFYSERDVVYEERRRSVESTPTGPFEVAFDAMFWEASSYHWPTIGWPSDLASITKAQADDYYSRFYAPQNLTAILIGDFDPAGALALAEKYLGSIPAGRQAAPEMITMETTQLAEKRFNAEAETTPGVWIRWHTPAFVHRDVPALNVLEEILNGPTGRLQKSLVLGSTIATSASASHDPRKYEGLFQIDAECNSGRTPEELEKAVLTEVEKLQKEPVGAEELQKVKNRYLASGYRQVASSQQLLFRYVIAEGRGSWRDADRIDAEVQRITPDDVQRVARIYFTKENRSVAVWTRKGGADEDPALSALPPEARGMARQMVARIDSAPDAAAVQKMLERLDQMSGQIPPEMKPAVDYIRAKAQARLAQLSGGK